MASGSSPPPPPDPYKTATAQTGSNIQTAIANSYMANPTIKGPTGTTSSQQTGTQTVKLPDGTSYEVPTFTQTTTLSPEEQRLYDQSSVMRGNLGQLGIDQSSKLQTALGSPVNLSDLGVDPNSFAGNRAAVEKAMFDRLAPVNQRDYDALETRLTNQGFQRGTEAFRNAMDEHSRAMNDQKLAITGQGLQEQQGMFGMADTAAKYEMQRRLTEQNQPLNVMNALQTGSQVQAPSVPGYNAGNVAGTDVAGSVYNSAALAQKQYEAKLAQQNAMMGGIAGLAGTLGGAAMGMPPGMFGKIGATSPKWGGGY